MRRSVQAGAEREAADWLVRREAGLDARGREELARWLAADAGNAEELRRLEATWGILSRPRNQGASDDLRRILRERRALRRRRNLAVAGAAASLALAALWFVRGSAESPPIATAPTVVVRPDQRSLADGSTVELNAGAEMTVDFSPGLRRVFLARGEAHFVVAKDATRPFVVVAGGIEVRAVGTAFMVRHGAAAVDVLVTEGRVAVRPGDDLSEGRRFDAVAGPSAAPSILDAGSRLVVPVAAAVAMMPEPKTVSAPEISEALAWRGRRLEFTGTPVREAVTWFNRVNRVRLVAADAGAGDQRLTGIFWADDPENFARLLEDACGLRTLRDGDVITLRSR